MLRRNMAALYSRGSNVEPAKVTQIYVHLNQIWVGDLSSAVTSHHLLESAETLYTLKLNFLAALGSPRGFSPRNPTQKREA